MATGQLMEREGSEAIERGMIDVETARAVQEMQARILVAKKFPRDTRTAETAIMAACEDPNLAEDAAYEYGRGDGVSKGPSIRLAEVLAQNWGNFESGTVVLERHEDRSIVQTFAWDIEKNVKQHMTFPVRHWRDTKKGGYALTDERDIYEVTANLAARRRRACILAVIPRSIADRAMETCERVLTAKVRGKPMTDRVKEILEAFMPFKVTREQIEKKFGTTIDKLTEPQYASLKRIYAGIRDNVTRPEDVFSLENAEAARMSASIPKATSAKAEDMSQKASAAKTPEPQGQPPSAGTEQESFENFTGTSLFASTPATETIPDLQNEIAALCSKCGYTEQQVLSYMATTFKNNPVNFTIAELKKVRDHYKADLAQRGVK